MQARYPASAPPGAGKVGGGEDLKPHSAKVVKGNGSSPSVLGDSGCSRPKILCHR